MPFRVMTFNIQCLVPPSTEAEMADPRAGRVADALLSTPQDEQPDVLVFNEVFADSARDILTSKLSSIWPNRAPKLDGNTSVIENPGGALSQDSGLAIFSKLPFSPLTYQVSNPIPGLPSSFTKDVMFATYNDSALTDSLADKGIGVARFHHPEFGLVVVAFTHLQSSYTADEQAQPEYVAVSGGHFYTEPEFAAIRQKQLTGVVGFLETLLGPQSNWPPTIFVGDFNINGVMPGVPTGEYRDVFEPTAFLGSYFYDSWPEFMSIEDLGYTQGDERTGERARFDFVCLGRSAAPDFPELRPHHMRTRHRSHSDHYALEALFNKTSPHCYPRDAELIPSFQGTSGLNIFSLEIVDTGAYQWVRIDQPGTYTIWSTADVEYAIYASNDLSDPWPAFDDKRNDVNHMGLADLLQDWDGRGLEPIGQVFSIPDRPFLVRVRSDPRQPGFTGSCAVGVFKHSGATKETAIAIHPQRLPGLDPLSWTRGR